MTVDPRTLAANLRYEAARPFEVCKSSSAAADLIERVVVPLHDAWLQAKPPCPTCHGRLVGNVAWSLTCTDCSESPGVQPFDKWTAGLVALWQRTNPEGCCAGCHHLSHSACLTCGKSDADCMAIVWPETAELRQIGGTR